jgi:hypothetical protein
MAHNRAPIPQSAQCPLWVFRDRANRRQSGPMSAMPPIATKLVRRGECGEVPFATDTPQQFDITTEPLGIL